MALRIITPTKLEIINCEGIRLDAKYFLVNFVLNELEKRSSCKVYTLEDLKVNITSGSYIDTYLNKEEGIPYIRVGNVKPFSIDEQEKSFVYVSKNSPDKIKAKENDIVLGRTQATIEKLGVASIIDKYNNDFVISQHISKITITNDRISPYYLIGYLNSKFYKAQTALATHGDTRVEMTHSQLKKVRVFFPKKEALKSIETKVKKIIEYNRASIQKIHEAKEILKAGVSISCKNNDKFFSVNLAIIQDFGIWNANSHLPKFTITEIELNTKFKNVRLGSICSIKKGIEVGSDNYQTELFKKKNDYAFIRTSDITNNEIDIYPDYFVSSALAESLNNNYGDIIFSKDGIIGETAFISKHDRVIIASGFAKIKLNKEAKTYNITPEYLFTILSTNETGYYPAKRRTVIASTIPHLREERLKEIKIPILDTKYIDNITYLIKEAIELKDEKKELIKKVREEIDSYFDL